MAIVSIGRRRYKRHGLFFFSGDYQMGISMQHLYELETRVNSRIEKTEQDLTVKIKEEATIREKEDCEIKDNYTKRFDKIDGKLDRITGLMVGLLITITAGIIAAYGLPAFFNFLQSL